MARRQSRGQFAGSRCGLRFGQDGVQRPFAIERLDDRQDYGEDRFVIIGMAAGGVVLFVAFSEREGRIRIISARRATQNEQDDYLQQNG